MISPERLKTIDERSPSTTWQQADSMINELVDEVRRLREPRPLPPGESRVSTAHIVGLETRRALFEGLIATLGRANEELGAEIERLRARIAELEPVEHDPYDAACNCNSCQGIR